MANEKKNPAAAPTGTAFENAKRAARGEPAADETALAPASAGELALMEADGMVGAFTEEIARELLNGGYEVAPRFIKLTEGMMVRGKLVDRGSVETVETDRRTGEVLTKSIPTWTIENAAGTARVRFLSSHQLEEDLTRIGPVLDDGSAGPRVPRLGEMVTIARMGDERTGKGMNVTRYGVAFERKPHAVKGA